MKRSYVKKNIKIFLGLMAVMILAAGCQKNSRDGAEESSAVLQESQKQIRIDTEEGQGAGQSQEAARTSSRESVLVGETAPAMEIGRASCRERV